MLCAVSSYFAPEDCADSFSLYTLRENQFVSEQQRGEGACHEATAMERCILGIRYPQCFWNEDGDDNMWELCAN